MDFLGIGPLELIFILIIALIVLGPKDMVKTGRTIGKFLRSIVQSPVFHTVQRTSQEMRTLPTKLMREAGLEESAKELQQINKGLDMQDVRNAIARTNATARETATEASAGLAAWTTTPGVTPAPAQDSAPAAPPAGNEPPNAS